MTGQKSLTASSSFRPRRSYDPQGSLRRSEAALEREHWDRARACLRRNFHPRVAAKFAEVALDSPQVASFMVGIEIAERFGHRRRWTSLIDRVQFLARGATLAFIVYRQRRDRRYRRSHRRPRTGKYVVTEIPTVGRPFILI